MVPFHLSPFRSLGNFVQSTLPVSFGSDTKSRWSLLSGVCARGSKRSHTGGKCVTCDSSSRPELRPGRALRVAEQEVRMAVRP